jgi:hypothetical protein
MKQKIHPLPLWGMKNTTFVLYLCSCHAPLQGRCGNLIFLCSENTLYTLFTDLSMFSLHTDSRDAENEKASRRVSPARRLSMPFLICGCSGSPDPRRLTRPGVDHPCPPGTTLRFWNATIRHPAVIVSRSVKPQGLIRVIPCISAGHSARRMPEIILNPRLYQVLVFPVGIVSSLLKTACGTGPVMGEDPVQLPALRIRTRHVILYSGCREVHPVS